MSVISAREVVWECLDAGITPLASDVQQLREELDEFLTLMNDYDEWDATRERVVDHGCGEPHIEHEPALTVAKLRGMLGYAS